MISGLLLDLSGVLYTDNLPIRGVADSLSRLQKCGLPIRYVTNTTRNPRHRICQQLIDMGIHIDHDDLYTAAMAAHAYLAENKLTPFKLIHPELMNEFMDFRGKAYDAVLIGDAEQGFTYNNMNTAFRLLMQGAKLIAMGKNRYFMQHDGLSIDAGAFVTALEYAAGTHAVITGKPDPEFFLNAVKSMGCAAENIIMIGDDVDADVNGAINAGMNAILVRTGKYQAGDENRIKNDASVCLRDFNHAVDWILEKIT